MGRPGITVMIGPSHLMKTFACRPERLATLIHFDGRCSDGQLFHRRSARGHALVLSPQPR
jgi:hypothetical protein